MSEILRVASDADHSGLSSMGHRTVVLRWRMDRRIPVVAVFVIVAASCASRVASNHGLRGGFHAGKNFEILESDPPKKLRDGVWMINRYGVYYVDEAALKLSVIDIENHGSQPQCVLFVFDPATYGQSEDMGWGSGELFYLKPGETLPQAGGLTFSLFPDGLKTWPHTTLTAWKPRVDGTCGRPPA